MDFQFCHAFSRVKESIVKIPEFMTTMFVQGPGKMLIGFIKKFAKKKKKKNVNYIKYCTHECV